MKTDLVIMAAGMGSRFGGLKQAAAVGANGEMIIDYSVAAAKKAGFDKAVIIIRKDIEKEFKEACGKRIEKIIETEYVFQEKDSLPDGYTLNPSRAKPWGTGHAVLCAKEAVHEPFLVINADDFYGVEIFKKMHDYLADGGGMCMAGFKLGNTLSENGTVSRGICKVEAGLLKDINEVVNISKDSGYSPDTIVSMNMWGLDADFFPYLEKKFREFLDEHLNEPKTEFFLPSVIDKRIGEENKTVKVIETEEKWYGVTYKEDLPLVREALKNFNM